MQVIATQVAYGQTKGQTDIIKQGNVVAAAAKKRRAYFIVNHESVNI